MDRSNDCTIVVDPAGASHLVAPSSRALKGPFTTVDRAGIGRGGIGRAGIGNVRLDAALEEVGPNQSVVLQVREDGVRFSFCPSRVHPMAMSAAIARLFELRPARVCVAVFKGEWTNRSFSSFREAVQYIVDVSNAEHGRARQSDFLSRPMKRMSLAPRDVLLGICEAWASGVRELGALQKIDRGAQSRLIVISDGDDPTITFGALDVTGATPVLREKPAQFRIADWPDVAFGYWTAQVYRETWCAAQPRLDALDCILKWPGRQATRYTYRRLMLPCHMASGAHVLLSVMQDDAGIDLRATRH
jgi:hypothetical protein